VDVEDAIRWSLARGGEGVIWYPVTQQMEGVFPHYAAKGVESWKIDFVDGDDQIAAESTYEIAQLAAGHRMLVDYQLAQYIVFEVPLQMLSDSPSIYRREQQSTDFITRIPTRFDGTE
jgi:alpha-glucosidase